MRDRQVLFHKKWIGLAQPSEGLTFSIPVLADAQIAPEERAELTASFAAFVDERAPDAPCLRHLPTFFRDFLGYSLPGMFVPAAELPSDLAFYAAEGGQEIRPTAALGRGPFVGEDPFAAFAASPASADSPPPPAAGSASPDSASPGSASSGSASPDFASSSGTRTHGDARSSDKRPWIALIWDLTESGADIDLDDPESVTGPWRYPPTAKLERLLRHTGVPIGFLSNGRHLRLVYAPPGEATGHLTFRVEHLRGPEGRPLLAALALLLHARRAHTASPEHTLEGLLAESRRRQADVTEALAKQVFEAVEILLAGFEAAARRDSAADRPDWLRAAVETEAAADPEAEGAGAGAGKDHFYQGVLSVVLRLVFLLYAEDQALLPVENPLYAEHLSLSALHARLAQDAASHPESMHNRFGAYGRLLALFRAVFFGVRHGALVLPPRRGRLFDPNTYPFLEGGLPGWTAAVRDPAARAAARPPSVDDGTIHRAMTRLVVFGGQHISYKTLDVVQIGSVYESLMGYQVIRTESPAVRIGKLGVWVEVDALRKMAPTERTRFLKETCGLNPGPVQAIDKAVRETASLKGNAAAVSSGALSEALLAHAPGRDKDNARHCAEAGRLVLQPGEERRRTGTHYTPPSLTEKVVRRTLEPLLACLGPARTPEQILQLKICDPAMGSGAFLVAACRALATDLVDAWTRQGEIAQILEAHGDAHLHGRRLVAQKCLYGVDKNPAAVELAKLSLWLVTLSRQLPFTFVDHALRHGDSLVGLDFKQISAFHWSPPGQLEFVNVLLRDALDQAVELRQEIVALADHEDALSQAEKRRLFDFSQQAIDRVRTIADACVGAFFAETKDAAREKERKRRLKLLEDWIRFETRAEDPTRSADQRATDQRTAETARREVESLAAEARRSLAPFHWWIEFPEVFFEQRPDPLDGGKITGAALMEAVVGNPPFLGGTSIIEAFGEAYRDWVFFIHGGAHGKCDLSAHFFRRSAALLGRHGAMGLVATNTISQGDTREGGLAPLTRAGFRVYDATLSMAWPGAAAVTVSIVHLAVGRTLTDTALSARLDGKVVPAINSRLGAGSERGTLASLAANAECSFLGCKVGGQGFVLTPAEAEELKKTKGVSAYVKPYLGGEEVNSNPSQAFERYVIDFGKTPLEQVEASCPELLKIVRQRVKPYRDTVRRDTWRNRWWQFAEVYPSMRAAIAPVVRCLVNSQVSKHLVFAFQPTDRIFAHTLYVYPLPAYSAFAVLQSRVHEPWARLLSSSMKTDLRYAASDCFETFPFPEPDPRAVIASLEEAGERLYTARAKYMVETEQGLTKTYNALKDPGCEDGRILALRGLHEAMDRAVLAAYGWSEVEVPPYCAGSDGDREKQRAFEDEVIDRLYVLNAARAAEEARLGLGKKAKPKGRRTEDDEGPGAGVDAGETGDPGEAGEAGEPRDAGERESGDAASGDTESGQGTTREGGATPKKRGRPKKAAKQGKLFE